MKRTSKESVQYGIDWLTQGALKWQEKNKCYGCHVQGQAIMGLSTGNTYKIDTNSLNLMCDYLRGGELGDGTLQFEKSNSIAAAQFFGMSMAYYDKYKGSSDKTGLINIAKWLLSKQQSDGSWRIDELEPPLQQGDIMVTANSLFTIKQACLYDTSQPWNDSITKGLLWLQSSEAKTIQDLIFKILGLSFTGQTLDNPVIKKDVEILFSKQNSDGGWSETQDLKSNNLTTGMAVYALKCAGINMNDERLIKGVSYLINNQQAFGSWPSENTISKRPSDYGPTAWAIAGLIDSSETLTIKIKYPIEEEKKTIEAEVFNSTFSHISYVAFYLDEKLLGKITKHPYYIVLPESSLSPGKHKIKVTVNTDDGQSVSDEKEVNFQGPLKIAIIKPEKAISLETFIEVDIKNKSDSKIKSVDYFLNEKTIGKVEESPYNLKFNTKNIPDGTYELKVIVSDSKGLQAFDSKTINIKKTFSLEIIDPGNGRDISEEKYKIRVKVINETGYSTEKIDYYIDGKPAGSSSKEPYDMEYDFSTIPGGDHELTAIAVNENNDKAEGKITFRLDKGLMIKIKKPEGGNIITGNTKIQSEVLNKTKSPVTMVEYFLNNNPAGKVFKDLYSLELQDLKQGNYKLKAVVYTKDGGKAFDEIEIEVRQHVEALITATVVDKNGKYISEIDPKSFILKEDNVEQNPLVVLSGEDIGHPSIVIIIDESKSIETSIEKVKEAANNFISMVDDKTRISVIFYSDSLRVNDFTTDKNKLKNTISTLKAHGGSVLYDSIYKASEILMKEKERKAIVLLTDGIDENDSSTGPGSKHNFLETVKYAKENNILIYTIGFKPTADKKLLETYSVETGGIFYFSPTVNDLTEIYKQLAGIFKCQYMIAYRSSNFKRDGSWRKVTINIKDNPEYKVITSGGYKEPVY
ncbi:MAG: von Willebrand factor type A domain protein [bacterium ADurb.Bin363]|nr:MAG: von Willebrand factor type A domain protein [bacterium ADurb.Bin363]